MISVFIPARNEAQQLPECLELARSFSSDIHVLDDGSMDSTAAIAESLGARVTRLPHSQSTAQGQALLFGGDEAAHRNWALQAIPFRHPWVLHLDADERPTPELIASIQQAVRIPGPYVAFRLRRRDFFMGRGLRFVQATAWYIRLFRPESLHFQRLINPTPHVLGEVGSLHGILNHYPFARGMDHWRARHKAYSLMEALQEMDERNMPGRLREAFLHPDPHQRRRHQKRLAAMLPCRPALRFLWLYLLKGGLFDGVPGLRYALLQAGYESDIVRHTRALRGLKLR